MKLQQAKPCPCGSGRSLSECCGPVIAGASQAETAEAQMRSRYSAFVLKESDYLLASWHPATRPESLELDGDPTEWLGLTILRTEAGGSDDEKGMVEFVASYRQEDRERKMHEASRFVREAGRWFYLDGTTQPEKPVKVGRNAPCPCGSGKKYKRCCGNRGL